MSTMKSKAKGYEVIECREGSAEESVGWAQTLREARKMATAHGRGRISGTPASLYETARAAGGAGAPGCSAPDGHEDEAVEWAGPRGEHGIFRSI